MGIKSFGLFGVVLLAFYGCTKRGASALGSSRRWKYVFQYVNGRLRRHEARTCQGCRLRYSPESPAQDLFFGP